MMFTIYHADVVGGKANCLYPHKAEITDDESLKRAVRYDYVCAEYRDNYRSGDNFLGSDCLPVDCDNDHSDNPAEWIYPLDVALAFPDVAFAVHYSRNHMKPKGGKQPRPKFHVLFAIDPITDVKEYGDLKKTVNSIYPYFDTNALDSARFFFGTSEPDVEIYPGDSTLTAYLAEREPGSGFEGLAFGAITEGTRNTTLSRFAAKVIKRFGDSDKAYKCFEEETAKCSPPLDDTELAAIWHSAQKFYARISSKDGYIPPDKWRGNDSLRPADYSDIGQAKVLVSVYGEELVYTDATDYMRYDGTHWVESKQLAVGACEEFLDRQLEEAKAAVAQATEKLKGCGVGEEVIAAGGKALEKTIDEKSEKAFKEYCAAVRFKAFVMKHRDMKYVTSALQAAKPMLQRDFKEFDSQEFLLNTPDGTYDLRYGIKSVRKHNAGDLLTKMTAVSPSMENMDIWLEALDNFFCGDRGLIEYVQQIAGIGAIGKVHQEALIIAYGEGSNGKSTFWNAVSGVLGTYSGTISADALTVGCKRNVKPEVAELKGKRLVIAAELEEGMRLNTSIVKQLCSTDEVSAEKKYKDPFKYEPTHTLVLYTNHLPRVGAIDDGTWRRLIVIPFNAKIKGKADIKNYADYLIKNAGGAILTWVIEGAEKAIAHDFKLTAPEIVRAAINRYRDNNDWLSAFIEDRCEVDPTYIQRSGDFYRGYRSYCVSTGDYVRSTADFYAGLESAGFSKKRTSTGAMIYGIRLKSEFAD